ncbi:carbohydrate esterase, CE3 family [Reinekea forsetii]|jgi:acyl-CoA thioesterase-1|uniref:Carbohydrate esterase, CE3 family n=2 Tax=Reinekea forsetii TaxID=1336806 RepID=A0A2K8KQA4_9GAMM|nr:carbohydrate esterase, CE3 family [Reinekea forsetii]
MIKFIPKLLLTVTKLLKWGLMAKMLALSVSFTQAATLMVHGDSLSAGYGILPEESWVSLVGQALGDEYRVINTSISGETSKGGLDRLPALLDKFQPDILMVELGANDGLRGYPIDQMYDNLQKMITLAQDQGIEVILLGIRLPPNFGKRYTEPFFNSFAELAQIHDLLYLPFILDNVAQYPDLMQADGLHPTKAGQPIIVESVRPLIERALARLKS